MLLAVLSPGDVVRRVVGWTDTSTIEENWGYFYTKDTDGDPSDGYQATGNAMVFVGQRFAVADGTSPIVEKFGLGVNPYFLDSTPIDEWWSIGRWTSEQDNLELKASHHVNFSENTLPTRLGQAVVAIRQSGNWTELLNEIGTGGSSPNQFFYADSDFRTDTFTLDTGDALVIALRKANNDPGFVFLHDGPLRFTALNHPPTVDDQTFEVYENGTNGSIVGTIAASDPDAGDSLSYSATGGTGATAFSVNSSTGEITVADSAQLETTTSFTLDVQVTDAGGLTDTATASISVIPTVWNLLAEWGMNEGEGTTVSDETGNGYDGGVIQDGGSPTWGEGFLSFDGADYPQGRVEVDAMPSLGRFDDFAVEARFRLTGDTGWHQDLASAWGPSLIPDDDAWVLGFGAWNGKLHPRFWVENHGPRDDDQSDDLTVQAIGPGMTLDDLNEWHTLKGVFLGGERVELYLDDNLIARESVTWDRVAQTAGPMRIGNMHWFGDDWHSLQGDIDYLRVQTGSVVPSDTTPPHVVSVTPAPGTALQSAPAALVATFNEAIDAATITAQTFRLVRSGDDEVFGNGNDVVITPHSVSLADPTHATLDLTGVTLAYDTYQITLVGSPVGLPSGRVTDLAGNALDGNADGIGGDDYVATFSIVNPRGEIRGRVWNDLNGDGQLVGEPGMSGWAVYAVNDDGEIVGNAITGSDGTYRLSDLEPDTLSVQQVLQQDWYETYPGTSAGQPVVLGPGDLYSNINFGNVLDTDEDGLLDVWETQGIDADRDGIVDLALNTDRMHKDLFVEVDAMVGQMPSRDTFKRVEDAFAAAPVKNPDGIDGITLHVLPDERDIEPAAWNLRDLDGDGKLDWPPEFDAAKTDHFGTSTERLNSKIIDAKRMVYRYAIFADTLFSPPDSEGKRKSYSGLAERPGNDFMVTLGPWGAGGSSRQQAGTFMHEFGHTLGLQHGGGDNINFKPNYTSVMNYTWQMPQSNYEDGWQLDYSRESLPPLDELNLSEPEGIGGRVGIRVPVGPLIRRPWGLVNECGAVDWNADGDDIDPNVFRDINWLQGKSSAGDMLNGYDDWQNLDYKFHDSDNYQDGVHNGDVSEELTLEIHRELERFASPSNIPPIAHDDPGIIAVEGRLTVVHVLANDVDENGTIDPHSPEVILAPADGYVAVNADGTIDYTPNPGFQGDDVFTYEVKDDEGVRSFEATVTITVVNAPPIPGDFSNNARVEQADLDLVLLNWGKPGSPAPDGWVNNLPDELIDQNELDAVLLNWGNTTSIALVSAPTATTVSDQSLQAWRDSPSSSQPGPLRERASDLVIQELSEDDDSPTRSERVLAVVAESRPTRRMGPHQKNALQDRQRERVLDVSLADYLDSELEL